MTDDLSRDLDHSVVAFQNLQAERLGALERENALLAELPTLKALMTSGDDLTIQDGAAEFWQLSGTDLFMLADSERPGCGGLRKKRTRRQHSSPRHEALLASPTKHYLIDGGSLYACALRPLYFGSDQDGTLLGYVLSGVSIERTVRQISQPTGVEATFLSGGQIVASTLAPDVQASLVQSNPEHFPACRAHLLTVKLGDAQFLSATEDLSATATSPLQLVVLKSFEPAERSISRIDRMVLVVGLLALLSGTVLMIIISRLVTRPLEELSRSVRAFGLGDVEAPCAAPWHAGSAAVEHCLCQHARVKSRKRIRRCSNPSGWRPSAEWRVPFLTICAIIWPRSSPTRSFLLPIASPRKSAPRSSETSGRL